MELADGDRVLDGAMVFGVLQNREAYLNMFRSCPATIKHGLTITVHQLTMQAPGLNTEEPKSAPKRKEVREVRLTVRVAWYLCLAAKFRTTLIGRNQFTVEYAGPVWLWYAAGDQERHDAAKDFETPYYNAHGFSDRPPAE